MVTPITLLHPTEFKVLKIIRIDGPKWNWFLAYLPYVRTYQPGIYDSTKMDLLDKQILEAIQKPYPTAHFRYSVDILFVGQLEDQLKAIESASRKKATVQFFPKVPYEKVSSMVGVEMTLYTKVFDLRLDIHSADKRYPWVMDFFTCEVPYDLLDGLVKTIEAV